MKNAVAENTNSHVDVDSKLDYLSTSSNFNHNLLIVRDKLSPCVSTDHVHVVRYWLQIANEGTCTLTTYVNQIIQHVTKQVELSKLINNYWSTASLFQTIIITSRVAEFTYSLVCRVEIPYL